MSRTIDTSTVALPHDFLLRAKQQFGGEFEHFHEALEREPITSIRLNERKPSDRYKNESRVPWCEQGRFIADRPSFTLDPLLHAGCYYVQESSSMFLQEALRQTLGYKGNLRVLDMCAAPGGKSLIISDYLDSGSVLVSNEIIKARNSILQENIIKWGCRNTVVTCSSSDRFSTLTHYFDCILADAPCSGEGMFRKEHETRSQWSGENVIMCSKRQQQIIKDLIPSLKPGGYLIYSTCTFAPEENEMNCQRWLKEFDLKCIPLDISAHSEIQAIKHADVEAYQFLPHRVRGEGLFLCVMQKQEDRSAYVKPKSNAVFQPISKKKETETLRFFTPIDGHLIGYKEDNLYASCMHADELNRLSAHLFITLPGVALGKWMREDFVPTHHAAMAGYHLQDSPKVALETEESLAYLRGNTLQTDLPSGWCILTHCGQTLGLGKNVNGRLNNHYPKQWRIRM